METPTGQRIREDGPVRATLIAAGLALFGIIVSNFATTPALLLEPTLIESPADASIEARTGFMILNFVGFVLAGALYLAATDRGWSYVDLEVPTKRGWLYVGLGIVAPIVFYVLVSVIVQALGLPTADNQVVGIIGNDQTMILVMIGIVFFFNAPAEEFLFRNIVQKRLYAAFTRMQSVGIASGIFALIHVPVYMIYADSVAAIAVSIVVVFGGALIFGALYAKTRNLVVPIIAHAVFNALQFGLLYLAIEYELEGAEPTPSLLVDLLAAVPG
ncbi:CPBP family intramembrane glutamic endopeptidase [Halopiger djelfimassiliensis]|uniref:CPBP family intramembrane glutamic endopeptidase n=1 Tax=Halopiger djelfimassiliensis TaxID=1293047 RepID=UPI00067767DB|nr:CPBP family intramembrane glutamic endopeptidase [Halopiger djelfimassiliensis]